MGIKRVIRVNLDAETDAALARIMRIREWTTSHAVRRLIRAGANVLAV